MSGGFEHLGTETVWEGHIASVHVERFRHADGEEVTRERVAHPGAVAVVAHDEEHLWLVRQPREPVREAALLELPAGKLDVADEPPLQTAKRELAEEIGKTAETWRELTWFYSSPGFSDERIYIFEATGLGDSDKPSEAEENERIEIERWPLKDLDRLIGQVRDGKTLVGLLMFRAAR